MIQALNVCQFWPHLLVKVLLIISRCQRAELSDCLGAYMSTTAVLVLPRLGSSSSSSLLSKRLPSTAIHTQSRKFANVRAATPCTCFQLPSFSKRLFSACTTRRYPAAVALEETAAILQQDLPTLTGSDKERLKRLRNVGISAHIDRYDPLDDHYLLGSIVLTALSLFRHQWQDNSYRASPILHWAHQVHT